MTAVRSGDNYQNKAQVRSDTLRGYGTAVNELFRLRKFPIPFIPEHDTNEAAIIIRNLATEENIANQRSPLSNEIAAAVLSIASALPINSHQRAVSNIVALGRHIGCRLSEYGQKSQTKYDTHKYPSGNEVIKAFCFSDWTFYDKQGSGLTHLTGMTSTSIDDIYDGIRSMTIKWRIQKNRRNGQTIRLFADPKNKSICAVYNALQIVMRKLRLDRRNLDTPLCVFSNAQGQVRYLTGKLVADLLRQAVKQVHPNISPEELRKYSAHSLRVWACVLLDEAGKSPSTIKSRLRWCGESYRLYLRDTQKIANQHRDALSDGSSEILQILAEGTLNENVVYNDDED